MDAQQKQQIADKLLQSNNILVTVSTNPSVDQLSACIGLTLALNKMGKHAAAVFSGQVPSAMEFLQPEKTIEKTTDSLRDFIISLDKSKADKLRYKVEDKVVKIFITPYKTSISDKDLEFSQGDFNVDVVLALGVHAQTDIDQAITAHGRILHDATVSTINVLPGAAVGTLNWVDPNSSSLSEMVMHLLKTMNQKVLDGQMATSFLTGIVAETQRFSNEKTQPRTMSISAELMAAGANQQLVATKLEAPKPVPQPPKPEPPKPGPEARPAQEAPKPVGPLAQAAAMPETAKPSDGTIEIEHIDINKPDEPAASPEEKQPLTPQIDIDREGTLRRLEELQKAASPPSTSSTNSNLTEDSKGRKILRPLDHSSPAMTGTLSGPAMPFGGGPDGLSLPPPSYEDIERPSGAPPPPPSSTPSPFGPPVFDPTAPAPPAPANPAVAPSVPAQPMSGSQFSVPPSMPPAPPIQPVPPMPASHVDTARDMVHQAVNALPPIDALNAMPVNLELRDSPGAAPPVGGPPMPNQPAPPPGPPPMLPPPQG